MVPRPREMVGAEASSRRMNIGGLRKPHPPGPLSASERGSRRSEDVLWGFRGAQNLTVTAPGMVGKGQKETWLGAVRLRCSQGNELSGGAETNLCSASAVLVVGCGSSFPYPPSPPPAPL